MYILGPQDDKDYHHELKPLKIKDDKFERRTAVIFRLLEKYTFVNQVTGRELARSTTEPKEPGVEKAGASTTVRRTTRKRRHRSGSSIVKAGKSIEGGKRLPRRR
jgi:hypothetical protein